MGNNISIASTDAVNAANFQNWFNDFPLVSAPASTQADNCRVFTMGLKLRLSSGGGSHEYMLYVNQRSSAAWQYWGSGMNNFPSTNIASWTTCSNDELDHVGAGQYMFDWDNFVGSGLAGLTQNDDSNIMTAGIIVTNNKIRVDTRNGSGALQNITSTGGNISIEMILIGKTV